MTDPKATIHQFLSTRIGADKSFTYDDDIFKTGLVNSLFALELVVYLENTFAVRIENEDLNLANFSTVNNIYGFIKRKTGTLVS